MNGLYAVAGASGAIGRNICKLIHQQGGTPLLIGRSADKLQKVNDEILDGKSPMLSGIDYTTDTVGNQLMSELKGETLQGMVYAVGSITLKPIKGCKMEDFLTSYHLNFLGAVQTIQACLPGLKKGSSNDNPSSIVLFSSVAARHGLKNHAVIGSNKAAVEGLTVSLSAELAPHIRVNAVAPSLTLESEMAKGMTSNEKMAEALAKIHPLPRLGLPADSAEAAVYLLSSKSSWMTGQVLAVDGGRSSILS